jgi:UDP-glucose 4-epimerase
MRVLVTGGCGFIGSHTVERLAKAGHEIVIIDDLSTGKIENIQGIPDANFLGAYYEDLNSVDLDYVLQEVEAVIHLAALVSVQDSMNDPTESFKRNTEAFHRLLSFLKVYKHPLVYASSAAVYGDIGKAKASETMSMHPSSPYGADKAVNDIYARTFSDAFGLRSVGLRYFNVYGTRQDPKSMYAGVIAKFIDAVKQGKKIYIRGDGDQTRSFINVKDVAYYNVATIDKLTEMKSRFWSAINIGNPYTITIKDLANVINELGLPEVQIEHIQELPGEIKHSAPSMSVNELFFGERDLIRLRQGLLEMI